MSNLSDVLGGIKTVIETNVSDIKVFDYPVDSVSVTPSVILVPRSVDYQLAFGGNSFSMEIAAIVLVSSVDDAAGFAKLYDHVDPTDTSSSIKRALEQDPTLDGKADDSSVMRAEGIGRKSLGGGNYFGFDLIIWVIKTVG